MPVALECLYRPGGVQDRLRIRVTHLDYMIANKEQVVIGGPSMRDGQLVGMFLLLATDDLSQADAFLAAEPYTRAGLFMEVRKTLFTRYLPQPHEGFLHQLRHEAMTT
ncbi:YciI family protein [Variovorax sp. RA8]|uniref:YciI family protein n=1 Tax=Variovorax sp. (strain JCM 16519 / RA8) TaxID=662548 RepID=UPI000AF69127|nr:YciI family protein [Variovorax sp. RA8]VTU41900.1 YciI-like protein [Variovorax sp. RA8]